jgi:hypothetical protein
VTIYHQRVSGVHRGRRGLRWRLVVAVLAAAVGRAYQGRHRLEEAALGLSRATVDAAEPVQLGAPLPLHVPGTRLAVVPVPASPDPLVDTMPHPVIRLFPMPVVEHDGSAVAANGRHEAALADLDAEREAEAFADLVNPPSAPADPYLGRHTA